MREYFDNCKYWQEDMVYVLYNSNSECVVPGGYQDCAVKQTGSTAVFVLFKMQVTGLNSRIQPDKQAEDGS